MLRIGGLVVVASLAFAGTAHAASEERPYFDVRASATNAAPPGQSAGRTSARVRDARAALERSMGRTGVDRVDPLTGTPRMLLNTGGALTKPTGASRTSVARGFLADNAAALGLTQADVDALGTPSVAPGPRGTAVVTFSQSYKGIPAYDNSAKVALDRANRVIEVFGSPQHDLSVSSTDPKITATQAGDVVRDSVDGTAAPDPKNASLTLFGGAGGPALAWDLTYEKSSVEDYHAVVDATSGKLLLRGNLVKFANPNDATIYPLYPGAPGGDPAGSAGQPTTFTFPNAWLNPASPDLHGAYAHVWSDVKDNNIADGPSADLPTGEEIPRTAGGDLQWPFTDFSGDVTTRAGAQACGPTLCSWDSSVPLSWKTNREQDGVEAFYLVSAWHDHLADPDTIGFTAPDNFEAAQGDAVDVNTDDGADTTGGLPDGNHLDNANMETRPRGQAPTMQMYLFQYTDAFPEFEYNGGDDALTVWHENTHGLSNRLITDADGFGAVNSPHAGAMGEAWSDWYALDEADNEGLLVDNPDVNGDMDLGVSSDSGSADVQGGHLTRTQGVDCPVGAGSSDPETACPGGANTGPGGYTLGDFGKIVGGPEVHADGEIWSETLWDLRSALIDNFGFTDGDGYAEAIITEAMRLSPPEPSMLDERDAILAADEEFSGTDPAANASDIIWSVFAHRGMGYFATATSSSDVHPAEDFNTPPDADAPTANVTGTVTDAASGLPLKDVDVSLGPDHATTGADGTYKLAGVAQGTYGELAFTSTTGNDPLVFPKFTVAGDTTKDAALQRDWAASAGGAAIDSKSSNAEVNGVFGCGTSGLLDQDVGVSWLAPNPNPTDGTTGAPTGALTQPFAVIKLPKPVDIASIGINPSSSCGDGASASLGTYKLEVSTDGTTFQTYKDGAFTAADNGSLHAIAPTGTVGQSVRYVKLTPLTPQRQSTVAVPCPTCSGNTDIGITELEVFGTVPNVAPTGTLQATPSPLKAGGTVSFTAAFTDADSAITGYDWDFDGDGTTDQSTTAPTTTHVYPAAGSFTAKVTAKDFVAGAKGTATAPVSVQAAVGPTGTLTATPASVKPTDQVTFNASSFVKGDADIDTYAWDFDGDGQIDRTTTAATTTSSYGKAGAYTAKVTVTDKAHVANSATATVTVAAPAVPTPTATATYTVPTPTPTPPATQAPVVQLARVGTGGKLSVFAKCSTACKATATLQITKKTATALGLKRTTVGTANNSLLKAGVTKVTVNLAPKVKKALRKHKTKKIKGTVKLTVRDVAGHKTSKTGAFTISR